MKKIDKEYSTQWVEEMKYLKNLGISYSFVKEIDGITTYKYKKTEQLFNALSLFYARKEVLNNGCRQQSDNRRGTINL